MRRKMALDVVREPSLACSVSFRGKKGSMFTNWSARLAEDAYTLRYTFITESLTSDYRRLAEYRSFLFS